MDERTPIFARISGAGRGAIKLVAAATVVALIPLIVPQKADAQYSITADSDGYVPVYDVCFAGPEVGYYSWYNDGYTTFGEISIDSCLLDSYGASPADYDRVLAHEQGHAAGYGHSSDPNSIMYPYAYIYAGGEQYEAPETEQYEAPKPEPSAPEDEQYTADLTSEVQQYDPEQEADEAEQTPDIREVPREELPAVRIVDEAEKKAEEKREAEKKAEERKKEAEQDEAVNRVRVEAAALVQAVGGADTLTGEEPRDRADALARTLEEDEAGGKEGPLADARTEAKGMASSLAELRDDKPARDRMQAVTETRQKAENLAEALDRAGAEAGSEDRTRDLDEASADMRTVASKLDRAEQEIEDQETEQRQAAQARSAERQSTEVQKTEQGFFVRIRNFFASTFG